MKTYASKIGREFLIPIAIILGSLLLAMAASRQWLGLGIISATGLFVGHLLLTTRYEIMGDMLKIKSGWIYRLSFPIAGIISIKTTRNFISSPAASMDRIEIRYNQYDSVIVSPKEKESFIKELIRIKPDIDVKL
jgi:hypothetical protein